MTQPTPTFLNPAPKRGRAAQSQTRDGDKSNPGTAKGRAAQHATDAGASGKQDDASATKPGQVSGKRTGGKGAGERQSRRVSVPPSPELTGSLRALATRPEMVDAVEEAHPGVLTGAVVAMARGAQIAGPSGVADRSALWRMVGMPWIGEGGGKAARDLGAALGAAYGEAVARLEGHRRHSPGTVREPVTLDAAVDSQI